jgi:hypothetical protein
MFQDAKQLDSWLLARLTVVPQDAHGLHDRNS